MHEANDGIGKVSEDRSTDHGPTTHNKEVMTQSGMQHEKERVHSETEVKPEAQNTVGYRSSMEATAQDEMQWGDGLAIIEEEPWPGDLSGTWPGDVSLS